MIVPELPEPAGFGNCQRCAYSLTGPIARCYTCARATIRLPSDTRCPVCDQTLSSPNERCANALCNSPSRHFEWATAIAIKSGELERAILRVKDGRWAWGYIFSRVVLGYLHDNEWLTDIADAIIPMPAYLQPGDDYREVDHAGWVIRQAAEQDETGLAFKYDPPVVIRTRSTPKMRNTSSIAERRIVAQQIYEALDIPDPARVKGRQIVVYDDVFTGGHTLDAVARKLKEAGAVGVYGLALARAQWRS